MDNTPNNDNKKVDSKDRDYSDDNDLDNDNALKTQELQPDTSVADSEEKEEDSEDDSNPISKDLNHETEDNNNSDKNLISDKHTEPTNDTEINSKTNVNDSSLPNSSPKSTNPTNPPGIIVLQWVTYAFWGWTVLTMSFLTAAVIAYFINDSSSGDLIIYGLAGIAVLMPISIICDYFYKKYEPVKKSGASSIVMVIHAVIFAIFGVGAIITGVFSVVALMLATGPTQTYYTTIFSSIIIAILYGATLLRTLNPRKMPWVRRFFSIFMVIVVGIIGLIGILGPFMGQKNSKNDTLKEQAIYSIAQDIDSYVSSNHNFPKNLNSVKNSSTGDTKKLIDNGTITYNTLSKSSTSYNYSKEYVYELCANFDKKSKNADSKKDVYSSYELSNLYHDAGKNCYQIRSVDNNPVDRTVLYN